MSKSTRRVQANKGRQTKVVKSGSNPEYVTTMQGLRSSNAAQPHTNKAKYSRKVKYNRYPEA